MRKARRPCRAAMAIALLLAVWPAAGRTDAPGFGSVTNLPIPRYVSLNSDEVNVRRGPGLAYLKDWVFTRQGFPVRVIDEYGGWRQIVDKDNAGGWVYHALITGRRTALVTAGRATLRTRPVVTADPVAEAEQGVIARLRACGADWCEIDVEGHRGWVPKSDIWGVDKRETFER